MTGLLSQIYGVELRKQVYTVSHIVYQLRR